MQEITTWISKHMMLPPCDMEVEVLYAPLEDEPRDAYYDDYYQGFFIEEPDVIAIDITHWRPKLKLVG